MQSILRFLILSLVLTLSNQVKANTGCDAILRDGTMARADYRTNDYLRRLLHWRYASQDSEQSKQDTSFGASIPIEGVLVGVDFTQNEAKDVRRAINQSLDKDDIQQHTLDYMLVSGDPVIADAWSKCMASSSGLFVWFSERKRNSAILNIRFQARENPATKFKIDEVTLSTLKRGTEPAPKDIPTNKCLKVSEQLKSGDSCQIEIKTSSGSEELLIVMNGHLSGEGVKLGASAFLPSNMKWIKESDYFDSRTLKPPLLADVSQNYWNRSVQSGAPVCVTSKELNNAIFVAPTATSTGTIICDGDGACYGGGTSVTDTKFCWSATVYTHYNSCTCTAAGSINLIRSRWVDADELEPVPGKIDQLHLIQKTLP